MTRLDRPTRTIQARLGARSVGWGALVALVVTVATGCGSSGPTGVSSQRATTPVAAAYDYARCMRGHGVTGFPDPHVSTSPGQVRISQAAGPVPGSQAPVFKAAEHACRGIIGAIDAGTHHGPGAAVLLAFAKCLRSHGLASFPDPDRQGRITRQMIAAAGIQLRAPAFLSAARACLGVTHGAITPADVRAASSGPH